MRMKWRIQLAPNDARKSIDIAWWERRYGSSRPPEEFWCSLIGRVLAPDGKSDTTMELARLLLSASSFRAGDDRCRSAFDAEVIDIDTSGEHCDLMTLSTGTQAVVSFKNEDAQDEVVNADFDIRAHAEAY